MERRRSSLATPPALDDAFSVQKPALGVISAGSEQKSRRESKSAPRAGENEAGGAENERRPRRGGRKRAKTEGRTAKTADSRTRMAGTPDGTARRRGLNAISRSSRACDPAEAGGLEVGQRGVAVNGHDQVSFGQN